MNPLIQKYRERFKNVLNDPGILILLYNCMKEESNFDTILSLILTMPPDRTQGLKDHLLSLPIKQRVPQDRQTAHAMIIEQIAAAPSEETKGLQKYLIDCNRKE